MDDLRQTGLLKNLGAMDAYCWQHGGSITEDRRSYIQQLVGQGEFELIAEESTCPLEKVKTEDGWADEIMAHMIRCKHCGQIFTCVVNTWRGSGHFKKGKG